MVLRRNYKIKRKIRFENIISKFEKIRKGDILIKYNCFLNPLVAKNADQKKNGARTENRQSYG